MMTEIQIDWIQTARLNAAEIDKGHMVDCTGEEAALLRGLADEIERLRTVLEKALALCKWCDGTGTVAIADVETGEQIGAEHCEKCWPLRSDCEADDG